MYNHGLEGLLHMGGQYDELPSYLVKKKDYLNDNLKRYIGGLCS